MARPTEGYRLEGVRVPGASTIAKMIDDPGGLLYWANQQGLAGNELATARNAAATPGTLIHECIEAHLNKGSRPSIPAEYEDAVANGFNGFLEWYDDMNLRPLETERARVSKLHGYGGTPDLVCLDSKERLYVVDWKTGTGSTVYPSQLVQAAGYGGLIHECDGMKPDRYGIHKFDRETGNFFPHVYTAESMKPCWEAFLSCLRLYALRRIIRKVA